jgi:egghead protein (zeste-white 4 protein)
MIYDNMQQYVIFKFLLGWHHMFLKRFSYYALIVVSVAVTLAIFTNVFDTSRVDNDITLADNLIYYSKFLWFTGALVAVTNIIGLLLFGTPHKKNKQNLTLLADKGWNASKKLIVVFVSRGDNYQALERSIVATANLLDKYKVNYRLDVVTDSMVEDKHSHNHQVIYHVVPKEYSTKHGSRYKARALHYVVERHAEELLHDTKHDTWVLHLDEESRLHESAIAGIHRFINNPKNKNAVGQGEIKYNAYGYGKNWLITAMDSIRSGDDLGRFRFQYNLFQKPLFGMHGSYILMPGKLEQKYGFDLGGKGSITEDAYFAIKCSSDGYAFKWVDGYIQEQSPYSLGAIIQQRRRWYCGLMYLAFDGSVKFSSRIMMMINMLLWTVAWLGPIVTLINLIFGGYFPTVLIIIAALLQGFYTSVYMIGLWHNLEDVKMSFLRKFSLYVTTFLLIPVANAIEGIAVFYGIVKPVKHFAIVHKN